MHLAQRPLSEKSITQHLHKNLIQQNFKGYCSIIEAMAMAYKR